MILIDSNIIVYAINSRSVKNRSAQDFLLSLNGEYVVSHQNILESIRVLTHRKFPNPMKTTDAVDAVERIVFGGTLALTNFDSGMIALSLIDKHSLIGNKIFDAYLCATMMGNNIFKIATDNEKDFKIYEGIKTINPFK